MAVYDENNWQAGQQSYNLDIDGQQFPEELSFQSFDATKTQNTADIYGGNPYLNAENNAFSGKMYTPMAPSQNFESTGEFEDEPPLLEELGINPNHIMQKTLSVLNPLRSTDHEILQDNDLAGPLVFCLAFGGILLLSGKVHFNYIYGIGLFGCVAMYGLLSLMAQSSVTFGNVVSVLGYCLLPMLGLAGVNILVDLQGTVGTVLTMVAVLWCSISASKLFVTALQMEHQQPLIAYPCAILYGVFALITIF